MKTVFVLPFNLSRLTGTPIRTRSTIKAVSTFSSVTVIAAGGGGPEKQILLAEGNVFYFTLKTLKYLRIIQPSYLHGVSTLAMLPALLYKLTHPHVCIVFEMHGWSWSETQNLPFFKRIVFLLLDVLGYVFSNKVILMSNTQKEFLKTALYKKKSTHVVWGPVDFEIVYNSPPERDVVKIGYLGNSSFWQGLDHVIEAARLLQNETRFRFILAGFVPDPHSPVLKNVTYLGKIERKNIVSTIQDVDMVLSPRIKGNVSQLQYPQKLSEYLACGRPVIASSTNDQKYIIESAQCGMIIEQVDGESIKNSILLLSSLSREERDAMGMRAAKFATKEFSFHVFTHKIKHIYTTL